MTGFNLPPGCNVSDIPGNRPEDDANEMFWNALSEKFTESNPELNEYLEHIFGGDFGGEYDDAVIALVDMAAMLAYAQGYNDGQVEAEIALALKEDQ